MSTEKFTDSDFNFSQGFSLNFEWTRDMSQKKFSSPTIFITGTLNIQPLFDAGRPKEKNKGLI